MQLPDELGAVLKAHALAQGVSTDHFISRVLEQTLRAKTQPASLSGPFESGYGMWARYGPAPSEEEIDKNRREMFRNFVDES